MLRLIAEGRSNKEIAAELSVTEESVKDPQRLLRMGVGSGAVPPGVTLDVVQSLSVIPAPTEVPVDVDEAHQ